MKTSSRVILILYDYPESIISAFIVRMSNRPGIPVSSGNTTLSLMIRDSLEAHSCIKKV